MKVILKILAVIVVLYIVGVFALAVLPTLCS